MINRLTTSALVLLKNLIETPSFSSEEDEAAAHIETWMTQHNIEHQRVDNNIWAVNKYYDENKPTILLNSHHDTVKPNSGYTKNPFKAAEIEGRLYGLGSNDAGGCLVSLLATFAYFYNDEDLNHNLIMLAVAEEESSGEKGISSMLSIIPKIDVAIVGEPTMMNLAVSEKGLVVLDATVKGTAGHAAHPNENNAIYNSIKTLRWFQDFKFEKVSPSLGEVKMTVTQIAAGKQHNAIPAKVDLVIDVRVNDRYTNQEIVKILQDNCPCDSIVPRSLKLNSSSIPLDHPLVIAGVSIGRSTYGSPTLSDQAFLTCPTLKLGPGDSLRSHTADEFIYLNEIEDGIRIYIQLLDKVLKNP